MAEKEGKQEYGSVDTTTADLEIVNRFINDSTRIEQMEKELEKQPLESKDEYFRTLNDEYTKFYNSLSKHELDVLAKQDAISEYQKNLLISKVLEKSEFRDGLPTVNLRTDRNRAVLDIFKEMGDTNKVLFYSPPGSGKSSLIALLIRNLILVKKRKVFLIDSKRLCLAKGYSEDYVGALAKNPIHDYLLSEKETEITRNDIEKKIHYKKLHIQNALDDEETIKILDNAHNVFFIGELWIQLLKDTSMTIIAFANQKPDHVLGTTYCKTQFTKTQSILESIMLYDDNEFSELVSKYKVIVSEKFRDPEVGEVLFSNRIRTRIREITRGYPCLVYRYLNAILNDYPKTLLGQRCSEDDLYKKVLAPNTALVSAANYDLVTTGKIMNWF